MATQSWSPIASDVKVPARPAGLWTLVCDYIGPRKLIKIEVSDPANVWSFAPPGKCGPDGDRPNPPPDKSPAGLLLSSVPPGTLIGKIGGSTAASEDGQLVFAVGSYCVLRLANNQEGPLFLTINDSANGFPDNEGEMIVNVCEGL